MASGTRTEIVEDQLVAPADVQTAVYKTERQMDPGNFLYETLNQKLAFLRLDRYVDCLSETEQYGLAPAGALQCSIPKKNGASGPVLTVKAFLSF
ncbi:MAG: hypothetical protein NUV51_00025 [Sulfuricaulis sp.]|nr:hypothetical protein [Sulfuricaulis sp.]